jgi:hypothetical protein
MAIASTTIAAITAAAAAVGAGVSVYGATQGGPKAQGQPQASKDPTANVYKDRNAQNAALQGGASTGTGSLLTSSGSVAGNTLLGQ